MYNQKIKAVKKHVVITCMTLKEIIRFRSSIEQTISSNGYQRIVDISLMMPVPVLIIWHIVGEKPYRCCFDGCDRAFAQMANLHHHMRNHEDHVKKAANKQYQCSICSRAYTNESSLKNHTIKVRATVLSPPLSLFRSLSSSFSLSSLFLSKTVPSRLD